MPEVEMIRREPNLKRFTEEEIDEMLERVAKLFDEGRFDEADEVINVIPLHWKSAKILKELIGVDAMIESGTNLSEAVDHFGMEWLEC